jgi:hypothetical protein
MENTTKKKRLRWKKQPRPTGLAGVCCGPQPHKLSDGETEFATVYPHGGRHRPLLGWYYVARIGAEYINTCDAAVPTVEEAKELAMNWIKIN